MLLTITSTTSRATDLGYLLHKNPARVQTFDLNFGKAHVFYPEAAPERCTAALLLDVDPVNLVRGQRSTLDQYVNDRPYVASSFMSVTLAQVYGSALHGQSKERSDLVEVALPFTARLAVVKCRGGEAIVRRLFEPLGYAVTSQSYPLDENFPDWGQSDYFMVSLTATIRLRDLLTHLYVLLPALDDEKHYWVGEDEVAKLLQHGQGWLALAANPKWLIYLPPTMSPSETTQQPGLLEHPAEAFAYFRHEGVNKVVCEEKHMGSRAVVIVCRDENVVRERFGLTGEGIGICYTRTGRRFFTDTDLEAEFLTRVRNAVDTSGLWDELKTDWLCLDCELMPWSAKAIELVRQQYAAVGSSSRAALAEAVHVLQQAAGRDEAARPLRERFSARETMTHQYVDAYRRYCWPVSSLEDFKLAPFHLLASEGKVYSDKDHIWHITMLARLCQDSLLFAIPYKVIDVTDPSSQSEGDAWWESLTARGGEGMVVKPLTFVAKGNRGLIQPAVKCRGKEYLRIIYGPEYTAPEHLTRLRSRGLGGKRSLALREFALGLEALERFVRKEPLYRVHECVFGVLALESEPIDPRL